MNRLLVILLLAVGFVSVAGFATAENFSHYTDEQLSSMSHLMQDATPEWRVAYREEVHRRFGFSIDVEVDSHDVDHDHHRRRDADGYHGDRHHSDPYDGDHSRNRQGNVHSRQRSGGGC